MPLAVGRPRSIAAVDAALSTEEKLLACITVRADSTNTTQDAGTADLYEVGTLTMIKRMERVGETMHIIAQGTERVKVVSWKQEDPYLRAVVQILPDIQVKDPEEVEATKRNVQAMVQEALALLPGVPPEVRVAMMGSVEPVRLAYFLGSILNLGVEQEQKCSKPIRLTSCSEWPTQILPANWRSFNCVRRLRRKRNQKWTSRSAITFCDSR